MILPQIDVSPALLDTGKVLPDSEATAGTLSEGLLADDPTGFAALMNGLSENQDTGENASLVLIEEPLDVSGKEPEPVIIDTEAGADQQSAPPQVHETPVSQDRYSDNIGIDPDAVVPSPDVIAEDMLPYDMTEPADSNDIESGNLFVEWMPEETRSLPTDVPNEVSPISHVSEEVRTEDPYQPIQTVRAGVSDDTSNLNVGKPPENSVAPGAMMPPVPEGVTWVPGTAESVQQSGFATTDRHNITPMIDRPVLPEGKDVEASPKVVMILPNAENGEKPQAGFGGRTSLVPSETFENLSIRELLAGGRQDASGNFAQGRDNGQSTSSDGGKPVMPDSQFMQTAAGQNPHSISGKPETVLPEVLQKSGSENLNQIEKMTWPLTGSPLTTVSEKGDIVEALRLPLESGEIRILTDIIEKAIWGRENGQDQVRIQLKPSFLGHLHLNVIMDQLKVTVEIRAETLLARDFIETNLQVLKADLQESGLEINKIDVLVDPDLNNQQDQGRASAQKQTNRMNEHSKEMEILEDQEPTRPVSVILSGGEESQIDCFV